VLAATQDSSLVLGVGYDRYQITGRKRKSRKSTFLPVILIQ